MGTTISFTRPDGKMVEGYAAEPVAKAGAPAIVVIQEWWGVNQQIRGVADRLAAAGYFALVPDLYRGKWTVEAEEALAHRGHLFEGEEAFELSAKDFDRRVHGENLLLSLCRKAVSDRSDTHRWSSREGDRLCTPRGAQG